MSTVKRVECVDCCNWADAGEVRCTYHQYRPAKHEIDPDHYCLKHQITTGEGDICWKCEEEFDHARMLMNLEMSKHQYSLWFLCSMKVLFKCPVNTFDDAKLLYHSLNTNCVTGVRIARYDPTEGCESVLYKFS